MIWLLGGHKFDELFEWPLVLQKWTGEMIEMECVGE